MNRKKLSQWLIKRSINFLYPFWKRRENGRVAHFFYDAACALTKGVLHCDAFTVVSHVLYQENYTNSEGAFIRKEREGCYANMVWSAEEEQKIWTKPLKDLRLYEHHDIYVCGDSDVIIDYKRKIGINDLCYTQTAPYKYGDSFTWDIKDGMMLVKSLDHKKARHIKSGIMIAALYSYNYFHAVLDNLIRLLAVEECQIPEDAAFIVDAVIYKYDSLKKIFEVLTANSKREVVLIERRELLHVDHLFYINHVNEFVIKIENWKLGRYDDYVFDWQYMQLLRDRLLTLKKPGVNFGSHIFISRKNIPRRQFNEAELMTRLVEHGFVSVSPEELTLEEQIALFNDANVIIGSSGAAMTNLLFCKPGAKVLIIENMKHLGSMYSLVPTKVGAACRHYSIQNQVMGKYDEDYVLDVDDFMRQLRDFITT